MIELIQHLPESAGQVGVTAGVTTVVLTIFRFFDRRMGRNRDRGLTELRDEIAEKLDKIGQDVLRVKWHVEGPDGRGGLLHDVSAIKHKLERHQ